MRHSRRSGVRVEDTDVPAESRFVDLGHVHLHAAVAGPEDGPPVILLHGFPEFWYGWRHQIRPLVEAGYRVIAPDQRGYNLSEKPANVRSYGIDALAEDVVRLIDAFGTPRRSGDEADADAERDVPTAHVVGHDWGAAVAWWVALHRPDRVRRLCAMNVPHPSVFLDHLRDDRDQQLRSWYTLFFQVPRIPEALSRAGNWSLTVRAMRESARPGTFSEADFDRYRAAWRQPGAFSAMLNWYRAAARERPRPRRERVSPPTLVLWGARGQFLVTAMARESVGRCERGRLELFEDATHWLHHEQPDRVADALVAFLGE